MTHDEGKYCDLLASSESNFLFKPISLVQAAHIVLEAADFVSLLRILIIINNINLLSELIVLSLRYVFM